MKPCSLSGHTYIHFLWILSSFHECVCTCVCVCLCVCLCIWVCDKAQSVRVWTAVLASVFDIASVFNPSVCRVCKPPITHTANYCCNDVISCGCTRTTHRHILHFSERHCHLRTLTHTHSYTHINIEIIYMVIILKHFKEGFNTAVEMYDGSQTPMQPADQTQTFHLHL